MATKHPLDGSEPPVNIGGGPPALKPEHIAVLHDIVTERAQASLQEIADELYDPCGVRVCDATIRRTLHAQGIVRLKPKRRAYKIEMPLPLWSPKRVPRLPALKSSIPMVPTAVSALATSNSYTTSASKSYGAQGTVQREPCTPLAKLPFGLRR